ncbi:MAG TPA: peptidoglycan-binding domain-containing protein [Micromonosporaceae bacterium]|nr:peptidoglycan-binding domain-containing protein [Micromonosporaceae bacterium]
MSTNAPGLTRLRDFANAKVGPQFFLGIVGDSRHTSGYHLGPDRINGSDYSMRLDRDIAGARKFPTAACAYDMGMGWPGSRRWLAWLVGRCRSGAFPQVREIIGSLDGVHKQYWSGLRGFRTERYTGDNHIAHTHLSVFRDTAAQDHSPLLRGFFDGTQTAALLTPPAFAGRNLRFTSGQVTMRGDDVRTWQARMSKRGWKLEVDGVYGTRSSHIATTFQREKGLTVDGIVGQRTWNAAWLLPVT